MFGKVRLAKDCDVGAGKFCPQVFASIHSEPGNLLKFLVSEFGEPVARLRGGGNLIVSTATARPSLSLAR